MNDMHYALDPTLPYLVNTIDQSNIFGTGSTCVSAEVHQALTSFNPKTLANCPLLAALQVEPGSRERKCELVDVFLEHHTIVCSIWYGKSWTVRLLSSGNNSLTRVGGQHSVSITLLSSGNSSQECHQNVAFANYMPCKSYQFNTIHDLFSNQLISSSSLTLCILIWLC